MTNVVSGLHNIFQRASTSFVLPFPFFNGHECNELLGFGVRTYKHLLNVASTRNLLLGRHEDAFTIRCTGNTMLMR